MKVGFIGTGEIAAAMVKGLTGRGHEIAVSDRNAGIAAALAGAHDDVAVMDNQAVLDASEVVFLCLMAAVARAGLPDLTFRADHAVISAMTDIDHAALRELCAPAREIAITIPMPFIAHGGCPLPVWPDSPALRALFGDRNPVLPQPAESAINPHFAATALSSVMFRLLAETADWLAAHTGDPRAAEAYMAQLFKGTFANFPADGEGRFAAAIEALSTEGGLNATLREHMASAGAYDALTQGLDGFEARLGLAHRR